MLEWPETDDHRPPSGIDLKCYDGLRGASMNQREFICVLGSIAWGFWPRRRTVIAALAALALLPIEASDAGLAVGCLQRLVQASQIVKTKQAVEARRFAQAGRFGEAGRLGKAPRRKACRPGAGRIEPCRLETGRDPLRSREVPDRSGCRTYRRIGRRDQRPQRLRVYSSICALRSRSRKS